MDRALALAHLGRHEEALAELTPLAASWKEIMHWMVVSPRYALGIAQRLAGDAQAALATQRAALDGAPPGPRRNRIRAIIAAEIASCERALAPAAP